MIPVVSWSLQPAFLLIERPRYISKQNNCTSISTRKNEIH